MRIEQARKRNKPKPQIDNDSSQRRINLNETHIRLKQKTLKSNEWNS